MKKIKLSELPLYQSLKGLFTIGTNENNESVRVPLEFIEKSTNEANDAAESANNAAKNANDAADAANDAAGAANDAAGSANKAAGDANAAAGAIFNELKKYIPRSLIGAINGVASLDAAGKILAAALNMPWRGNFTGNFQASNVEPGIYGVDDRKIGPNPLNGENAHGVMLVFPDRYKTTLFLVGRPNGSQYGTAPEIYARRWLETANSWTSWFRTDNYAKRDEIPTVPEYTLAKSGSNIQLKKDGVVIAQVTDSNTTYTNMTQAEADTGTATTARSISAKVLNTTIDNKIAKKGNYVVAVQRNGNTLTFQHTFSEIMAKITELGADKVFLLANDSQLFDIEYYVDECICFKGSDIESGMLESISLYDNDVYDIFTQNLQYWSAMTEQQAKAGTSKQDMVISPFTLKKALDYHSSKHLVLKATLTNNIVTFEDANYFELANNFIKQNPSELANVKILLNDYKLFSLNEFFEDEIISFTYSNAEENILHQIFIYPTQNTVFFETEIYDYNYRKAKATDLTWEDSWSEGGSGDLLKVELLRKGYEVQLSGCVTNPNDNASVGKIFTIPKEFRPTRKISWCQIGQQWFQQDGINKAVSYFCQINSDGTFELDKLNIGGVQVDYQANKKLFITGTWLIG